MKKKVSAEVRYDVKSLRNFSVSRLSERNWAVIFFYFYPVGLGGEGISQPLAESDLCVICTLFRNLGAR